MALAVTPLSIHVNIYLFDVFQVYGFDMLGRDVILGYVSILLPVGVGVVTKDVLTYVPLSSSLINEWWSWAVGSPPEVCSY